jgi:hypothetical protein
LKKCEELDELITILGPEISGYAKLVFFQLQSKKGFWVGTNFAPWAYA